MTGLAIALLAAHACLLALMAVAGAAGRFSFGWPLWVVAAAVPVAGPASGLAAMAGARSRRAGRRARDFDEARAAAPVERSPIMAASARETVPFEDAMLVSDQGARRSLMMDVLLFDGAEGSSSSLVRARSSQDSEVSHYASAATMRLATNFDEALAHWDALFSARPYDPDVVRHYLVVLSSYLESDLASGEVRRIQETRYQQVLGRKIQIDPQEEDYARLADSLLTQRRASSADAVIRRMERLYPGSDDAWLLRMRYWYVLKRPDQIMAMVHARAGEHVSARVRATMDFWEKAN